MSVSRPHYLTSRLIGAFMLGAAAMLFGGFSFAAEGPTLPPAEYKPLPVGTKIKYDNRIDVVTRSDGFLTVFQTQITGQRVYLSAHALFGESANDMFVRTSGSYSGAVIYDIDRENKKKLEAFWPIKVGNKLSYRLEEQPMDYQPDDGWTITLEVSKTEAITLNGLQYPTYVIEERGESDTGKLFTGRKWYQPGAGLVTRGERVWEKSFLVQGQGRAQKTPPCSANEEDNYSLVEVTYPNGTTT